MPKQGTDKVLTQAERMVEREGLEGNWPPLE
jgi:hypothetical protein